MVNRPIRGDILAYHRVGTLDEIAIDFGEYLQDGPQREFVYHVSIAVSPYSQLAAIAGKGVIEYPIMMSDPFAVYRPPIPMKDKIAALNEVERFKGERYDWLLIADDALRMLSRDFVHLPDALVRSEERTHKICSSLVVRYLRYAHFKPSVPLNFLSTPQDVAIALRKYRINS